MENSDSEVPRCPRCGDVIGVYEPVIVCHPEHPERPVRRTSRAAEGRFASEGVVMHERCYAQREACPRTASAVQEALPEPPD